MPEIESIRIEKVENGYTVRVHMKPEEKEGGLGDTLYPEPKEFIAKTKEEVNEHVNKFLGEA